MNRGNLQLLNEKMKFMRFLDYGRWGGEEILNYEWLNLADKNASGDQILLTHYLGYITDRQTSFEFIFERLDYIFSQMVCDYMDCRKSVDELLDPNQIETTYFIKRPGKEKYAFKSHPQPPEESSYPEITKELQWEGNGIFYAASRFYTNDYVAIRLVLEMLDKGISMQRRSLISFIKWAIGDRPKEDGLERLLYALWLLGYQDVGQWTTGDIKSDIFRMQKYKDMALKRKEAFEEFVAQGLDSTFYRQSFARNDQNIKNNNRFSAKRVICYLRDLFKFKPLAEIMCQALGHDIFDILKRQIPDVLELPGDVWNNNGTFQKCLRGKLTSIDKKNDKPNIFFRRIYNELCKKVEKENVGCYPEQLDCTFSFVPRMCEASGRINCVFCPINEENMKDGMLHIDERFCHHDEEKYCPFLLLAAGFKVKCGDMEGVCPNWQGEESLNV